MHSICLDSVWSVYWRFCVHFISIFLLKLCLYLLCKPSPPWCAIACHIYQLLNLLGCHICLCFSSFQQVAESKLAKFVEDIIVPPRMVDIIIDGEVIDGTSSWHALPCVFVHSAYGKVYVGIPYCLPSFSIIFFITLRRFFILILHHTPYTMSH